ncbi:MAG: NAD(P)-binding protein [Myxococcales bacterium]|nr:NAD(P)-binding protein [Myxococcales bacterium]
MEGGPRRERIAILGGGLGGIAAADYLSRPEHNHKYDITVYQLGWRLGGKAASGRNAKHGQRIEEHGIHVMFGFYDHVFEMLQYNYTQLGRDWKDLFNGKNEITVMDRDGASGWKPWTIRIPTRPGTPGEPRELRPPWALVRDLIAWAIDHALETFTKVPNEKKSSPVGRTWFPGFGLLRRVVALLDDASELPEKLTARLRERLDALGHDLRDSSVYSHQGVHDALEWLSRWAIGLAADIAKDDHELRVRIIVLDFLATNARGVLADHLLWRPLSSINHLDYRQWLRQHGGSELMLGSPLVRAFYDLVFANPNGDESKPGSLEAGTLLSILLRSTTYRGYPVWEFKAGMGDVVFAPPYEALRDRGVHFAFFHKVTGLHLNKDRTLIETINISQQVRLSGHYDPLCKVGGMSCWPSEPLYEKIENGEALKGHNLESPWDDWQDAGEMLRLARGQDFDRVVLAIPPAALASIGGELLHASARWREMVTRLPSVQTQSFQAYCDQSVRELGYEHGTEPPLLGTYSASPLSNWVDATSVREAEAWSGAKPQSINFFTGMLAGPDEVPLTDPDFSRKMNAQARATARELLERHIGPLWPNSLDEGGVFDWARLLGNKTGAERLDDQYVRANVAPSERYVQTPAGSSRYRLDPKRSGFDNLFLAGDWTHNAINIGSAEASVMSGRDAASGILEAPYLGQPRYVDRGSMQSFSPPVSFTNVDFHGFVVDGERQRIADYCHRLFGSLSNNEVRAVPLGSKLILAFVHMPRGVFKRHESMGFGRASEVDLFIPVAVVRRQNGRDVVVTLAWFAPYVFVDNAVAMTTGREVWGWPKQHGWVTMPGPTSGSSEYVLDTIGVRQFGPDQPIDRVRLLRLTGASHPRRADSIWSEAVEALRSVAGLLDLDLKGVLPNLDVGDDLEALLQGKMPIIFLKQFRSVEEGDVASYQAIVTAPGQVRRFRGHLTEGDFKLDLSALDSHPLGRQFGIVNQTINGGLRIQCDLEFYGGHELWRAGT